MKLPRLEWLASSLLAVASVAWALLDPRFRDAEGLPAGAICLPFSFAAALLLLGWPLRTQWRKAAAWFALAMMGQAVALQMIDAGVRIHFQHYRPFGFLLATQPWHLAFLTIQFALVTAGFLPACRPTWRWLRANFRPWQLIALGMAFGIASATVSENVGFYARELLFAALLQAVNLANIVLAAVSVPRDALPVIRERLGRWLGDDGVRSGWDRFPVLASLWIGTVAGLLGFFVYERHPHIPDEVVYLLHARYFAEGKLTLPAPPVQPAFDVDLMHYEATYWFCPVPPGWPALLALGVLAGVPWLVNPLLGALGLFLACYVIGKMYGRRTARIATTVLCISPWYVFMAMNFMTHMATLAFALAAAAALIRARESKPFLWALLAGLSTGAGVLVRPLEGFLVGCLLGIWSLGFGGKRLRRSAIGAFLLGGMLMGALNAWYNAALTGDPMKFPIMAYTDKYYGPNSNALGFGPERGLGWPLDPFPGHGPIDAAINTNLNLFSLNIELLGWSTGSILFIAFFVLLTPAKHQDFKMLSVIAAVTGAHFFYYYSGGPDFGPRYWFLIVIPCVVLTVRGMEMLAARLRGTATEPWARVCLGVAGLCVLALVNYFPWRAVDKYHHYLRMRPDVRRLAAKHHFGKSLILIRGERHPDYASAAAYNPLDLRAPVPIYAWDRSPEVRAAVVSAYRDRPVWILEGPSVTKQGFRVLAGPLQADELPPPPSGTNGAPRE